MSSWRRRSCPPDRSAQGPGCGGSCSNPAQTHWHYRYTEAFSSLKCDQCPTSAFQILSLKTPALCRKGNDHGMDVKSVHLYIALCTTASRRERDTCSRAMMESRSRYEVASRENRTGSPHRRSKQLCNQWIVYISTQPGCNTVLYLFCFIVCCLILVQYIFQFLCNNFAVIFAPLLSSLHAAGLWWWRQCNGSTGHNHNGTMDKCLDCREGKPLKLS